MCLKHPNPPLEQVDIIWIFQDYSGYSTENKIIKKFWFISHLSKNNPSLDNINTAHNLKGRFW